MWSRCHRRPRRHSSMANLESVGAADLESLRQLEERILELQLRLRGEHHNDSLMMMGDLAATLECQGDLAGSVILRRKMLEVVRSTSGERDPRRWPAQRISLRTSIGWVSSTSRWRTPICS